MQTIEAALEWLVQRIADRVLYEVRIELDSRERLYSAEEISAKIGWDLAKWRSYARRHDDFPKPYTKDGTQRWSYAEVLAFLRTQGDAPRRFS